MTVDPEVAALVEALIESMTPEELNATIRAGKHWLTDPMGCIDIVTKEHLHGPYNRANLILTSMGVLSDLWPMVDEQESIREIERSRP